VSAAPESLSLDWDDSGGWRSFYTLTLHPQESNNRRYAISIHVFKLRDCKVPPFTDGSAQFTTVPLKALSGQI